GTQCHSLLINIPTGLGKTAADVVAWLWNRVARGDDSWPRRLAYCLPMRTLGGQTQAEISAWMVNLLKDAGAGNLVPTTDDIEQLRWLKEHSPVILMGGEENTAARREWDIHPERPAILIGTQDMLLSRALNRGYGMARARWPMHFGLLNNDCLWAIDETQLMGAGLATTAQLQAFRIAANKTHTWWMSATLQTTWLETPDTHKMLAALPVPLRTAAPTGIAKPITLAPATDEKGIAAL